MSKLRRGGVDSKVKEFFCNQFVLCEKIDMDTDLQRYMIERDTHTDAYVHIYCEI